MYHVLLWLFVGLLGFIATLRLNKRLGQLPVRDKEYLLAGLAMALVWGPFTWFAPCALFYQVKRFAVRDLISRFLMPDKLVGWLNK